ncbi:MAG TPA: zinc ribbon domain-containing protein [Candidatus Acidoferrales bacterium]|nr:zinc ribbon domain-containing protein [Candidatus Acidoferrales bacterium]
MPLYEYKCVKCGHRFEKIESVSASETKKCPECGATARRTITAPAIQFKGSGWYVTDYAGKNSDGSSKEGKGAKEPVESKTGETKSSETKSAETKTAPATASKEPAKKKK